MSANKNVSNSTIRPTTPHQPTPSKNQLNKTLESSKKNTSNVVDCNQNKNSTSTNSQTQQAQGDANDNSEQLSSIKIKTETAIETNSQNEEPPSYNKINEKLRNVYVIAPTQSDPETYLVVGEDGEMMLLKVNLSQQIYANEFHAIVNIRYKENYSKDHKKIKLIKAGTILQGKNFHIKRSELDDRVQKTNIKLVEIGKEAPPIKDKDLKAADEDSVIDHLEAKVIWKSPTAFDNGELNAKCMTERGLILLITLDPDYHDDVEPNKVYRFIQITKTKNWPSRSQLLQDVVMKFRTRSNTTIEEIRDPSPTFKELGKEVATVLWIDQKLKVFNQCPVCLKGRFNGECRTEGCQEYGRLLPDNPTYKMQMLIDTKDSAAVTVQVWNDQLLDFPSELVPTSKLAVAIALHELEAHFKGKQITYKNVNFKDGLQNISNVCLKLPIPMDID